MPKVTEAHLEARRRQILDAALACFSRQGFHQSTMQDICQEAELSPGAVYRYFSSKEEIIEARCEEELQRNMALAEDISSRGDTLQVLGELVDSFFRMLAEWELGICSVNVEIWAEALRNPRIGELFRHRVEAHLQAFTSMIRRAQEQDDINPELDPRSVARVMVSLFNGLMLQKGLDPSVDIWSYMAVLKALHSGTFWTGRRVDASTSRAQQAAPLQGDPSTGSG